MEMIEKICNNLESRLGKIYVDKIINNDTYYLVYLTDFLGKNVDKIPYRFDKRTGEEVGRLNIDHDYDKNGCDIPVKYKSGRQLIIDQIMLNDSGDFDNITLEELNLWLDIEFSLINSDVSTSILYAVTAYYVGVVNMIEDKKDRMNPSEIIDDRLVRDCLKRTRRNIREKDGEFLIPDYIHKFHWILVKIRELDVMFSGIDTVLEMKNIVDDYTIRKDKVFNLIDELENPLYDKEYLKNWTSERIKIIDEYLKDFYNRVNFVYKVKGDTQEDIEYLIKFKEGETYNWINNYSEEELKDLKEVNINYANGTLGVVDEIDMCSDLLEGIDELSDGIDELLGINEEDKESIDGTDIMCGFDSIDSVYVEREEDKEAYRILEEEEAEFKEILSCLEEFKRNYNNTAIKG